MAGTDIHSMHVKQVQICPGSDRGRQMQDWQRLARIVNEAYLRAHTSSSRRSFVNTKILQNSITKLANTKCISNILKIEQFNMPIFFLLNRIKNSLEEEHLVAGSYGMFVGQHLCFIIL